MATRSIQDTSVGILQTVNIGGQTITALDTDRNGLIDEIGIQNAGEATAQVFDVTEDANFQAVVQNLQRTTGLTIESGKDGEFLASLSVPLQTELKSLSAALATSMGSGGSGAAVQGRWAEFIGKLAVDGNVDVNALVQAVLRDAYMENTKDLHFYAQKVKYYNELKDLLRKEATNARNLMSTVAGQPDDTPVAFDRWTDGDPRTNPDGSLQGASLVPASPPNGGTKAELEAYIKSLEERLNSVGDDAQLANVDLQNMLQKQQQTLQMMSNISKMLHDTAMAVIRKIGG